MNFGLSDSQREIKQAARKFLAARAPWPTVREAAESGRYDGALWQEMAELGWPGIAVGEEHGGQGFGAVELAVVLEEAGYACAATPLFPRSRPWRRRPPATWQLERAGGRFSPWMSDACGLWGPFAG